MRTIRRVVSVLLLSACGGATPEVDVDSPRRPEAEQVERTHATPAPEIPLAASPAVELPGTPLDRLGAPIYGHIFIPHPAAWLAELQADVVPVRQAAVATPESLLALLALTTGLAPKLTEKTDLRRPLGCVVGELAPEPEVACVFGYRGGAQAFVQEVGAHGTGEGHVGAFQVENTRVYVDALAGDVVLSLSPKMFARAAEYLRVNLIQRADTVRVDLEVVIFTEDLLARHGEALAAAMSEPDEGSAESLLSARSEAMRRFLEAGIEHRRRSDALSAKKLGEYSQAVVFVDLDRGRLAFGAHAIPRQGGRFPRESLSKGRHVDFERVGGLPAEALALFAIDMDPWAIPAANRYTSGPITDEEVRGAITTVAAMWTAVSGGAARAAEAALTRHFREDQELYAGPAVWAAVAHPSTPVAVIGLRRLAPGRSGRESWLAWTEQMKSGVLRGELTKVLSWSFTPDAWRLDGAEVDRWAIQIHDAQLLATAQAIEPKTAALFANGLIVDRLERDGHVYYVVAPGAEEALFRRLFAAEAGERRLGDDPRFASLRARDPQAHMLFAVDVARTRGTLAAWPDLVGLLEARPFVDADVGEGLDDVSLRVAETDEGVLRGELVIGPGLLRALRGL